MEVEAEGLMLPAPPRPLRIEGGLGFTVRVSGVVGVDAAALLSPVVVVVVVVGSLKFPAPPRPMILGAVAMERVYDRSIECV